MKPTAGAKHKFVKSLLSRKGKRGPFKDKRKITLVLNGGLMASIVGAGGLRALEELKLTNSFDTIYTASAGFLNACYFLTGQTQKNIDFYANQLAAQPFINRKKFWHPVDLSIVRKGLRKPGTLNLAKLYKTKTKLYILLYNLDLKRAEYIELHSIKRRDFYKLADASISMKYFGDGPVKLNGYNYIDGQFTGFFSSATPDYLKYIRSTNATNILILYSRRVQWERLKLRNSERLLNIYPEKQWNLFNFETNQNKLIASAKMMEQKVMQELKSH